MKDFFLYLVILSFVLLCSGRPRDFYMQKNGNYLRRFLKSFAIGHDELFCPRVIEGSGSIMKEPETRLACGRDYDLCSDSLDCGPGLMCCPSGCIYKCVVPQRPKTAIATDWIVEPEALTIGGSSWLIEENGPSKARDIECSTSVFPGIEPLQCLNGYRCIIQMQEDALNQIPNRGICTRSNAIDSGPLKSFVESFPAIDDSQERNGASCLLNGKQVPHGYHDIIDCTSCCDCEKWNLIVARYFTCKFPFDEEENEEVSSAANSVVRDCVEPTEP